MERRHNNGRNPQNERRQLMYSVEHMMDDIADNIKRDSDESILTKDSIIKRLRRFKENIIDMYREGEI